MILLRIMFFFAFKSNVSLVEIQTINESKIYSLLNSFYNYFILFPFSFITNMSRNSNSSFVNKSFSSQNVSFLSAFFDKAFTLNLSKLSYNYYYYLDVLKLTLIGNSLNNFMLNNSNYLINMYERFLSVIR